MAFSLLNLLIIIYILSLVACLFAAVTGKIIHPLVAKVFVLVHLVLLLAFVFLFFSESGNSNNLGLACAMFICSGMVCFGMVVRKKFHSIIKIYFGTYLLTFPVFLISPSTVFSILSAGVLKNKSKEIPLGNNFFLVRHNAMLEDTGNSTGFKVIEKKGMFNKTISRNIQLNEAPDSAKILRFDKNVEISLRTYFRNSRQQTNFTPDSQDIIAPVAKNSRDTLIQLKKQNN